MCCCDMVRGLGHILLPFLLLLIMNLNEGGCRGVAGRSQLSQPVSSRAPARTQVSHRHIRALHSPIGTKHGEQMRNKNVVKHWSTIPKLDGNNSKDLSTVKSCIISPNLKNKTRVFSCHFPNTGPGRDIGQCLAGVNVPVGTVIIENCKSPYVSRTGHQNVRTCSNGEWYGPRPRLNCFPPRSALRNPSPSELGAAPPEGFNTVKSCTIPQVYLKNKTRVFSCHFPSTEAGKDLRQCLQGVNVPVGTILIENCKPPYASRTGHQNVRTCRNGGWFGPTPQLNCFPTPSVLSNPVINPVTATTTLQAPPPIAPVAPPLIPASAPPGNFNILKSCLIAEDFPQNKTYVFSCQYPAAGSRQDINQCLAGANAPFGTIIFVNCQSPYLSKTGHPIVLTCSNGEWAGYSQLSRLYCVAAPPSLNQPTMSPGNVKGGKSCLIDPDFAKDKSHVFSCEFLAEAKTEVCSAGIRVPSGTKIIESCGPSYDSRSDQNIRICENGVWSGDTLPLQCRDPPSRGNLRIPITPSTNIKHPNRTCPSLTHKSSSVNIECTFKNSVVETSSCDRPVPIDSKATYSCKEFYESTGGVFNTFRKCKEDGTWTGSGDQFRCVPQCGISTGAPRTPFITRGRPTLRGQWPWHAALFLNDGFSTPSKWNYHCGGSLISDRAILTAAHCVTFSETTEIMAEESFRIDLGRYHREERDEFVQSLEVEDVFVHPSYSPWGYDSDIALIILKSPVKINHHVRPICFPHTSETTVEELHLSEHSIGTVVGWGRDEVGELADTLKVTSLPFVSPRVCLENFQDSRITQLQTRSTTYCAGFKNGTNVCRGDSGGGMVFPLKTWDSTRWYLQGIVSAGMTVDTGKCDPEKYSIFTRVGRYADWIVRQLSEMNQ